MDIEVISTNGDGPDVDAVISGSAQFAISTPNRLFTAFEQGKPLKAVGMLARRMAIDCAMNKQVADKLGITTETPLDTQAQGDEGADRRRHAAGRLHLCAARHLRQARRPGARRRTSS